MKAERLVLKEDDILVIKIPFNSYNIANVEAIQKNMRKKLYPRKNAIVILPDSIKLEVIGKEEIKEVIRYSDEWQLWDGDNNV